MLGCGGNHWLKDYPHIRENPRGIHNVDGTTIVEDMARATPWIYFVLEDQQAYH